MKSVNKVILIGNLGKDPELKFTPNGKPVAHFSMATNERFKGRDGQWQDRTEWHNIVAWERTAEIAKEYLSKGSKVYVEGRIQQRSWNDKTTGDKKYMTEIVVTDLVLLGARGQQEVMDEEGDTVPLSSTPPVAVPAGSSPFTDEDIPF